MATGAEDLQWHRLRACYARAMNGRTTPSLREGIDFYREGPFTVFTETYLRNRGYCCESGCRHCPWGYRADARTDVSGSDADDVWAEEP